MQSSYKSQYGQDRYIHNSIVKDKKGGIFVDIGATDGVHINNTFFLETERGWEGICVEPISEVYAQLKRNRKCRTLNICAGDRTGKVTFTVFSSENPDFRWIHMLSGVTSYFHKNHIESLDTFISQQNCIKRERIVNMEHVSVIFDLLPRPEIDYLSVDTEGGEEKILAAIDYNKYFIHIISVEDNWNEGLTTEHLKENGFLLIKHLGVDRIFINQNSCYFKPKFYFLSLLWQFHYLIKRFIKSLRHALFSLFKTT